MFKRRKKSTLFHYKQSAYKSTNTIYRNVINLLSGQKRSHSHSLKVFPFSPMLIQMLMSARPSCGRTDKGQTEAQGRSSPETPHRTARSHVLSHSLLPELSAAAKTSELRLEMCVLLKFFFLCGISCWLIIPNDSVCPYEKDDSWVIWKGSSTKGRMF